MTRRVGLAVLCCLGLAALSHAQGAGGVDWLSAFSEEERRGAGVARLSGAQRAALNRAVTRIVLEAWKTRDRYHPGLLAARVEDRTSKVLCLTDGSLWVVAPLDRHKLFAFLVGSEVSAVEVPGTDSYVLVCGSEQVRARHVGRTD